MAWRQTSRHARPKGRSSLKAAYADLQSEMGDVRRHRYADSLENTRLTAIVDALTVQVSRLQGELSAVRAELHEARSLAAAPHRDPYVEVLAAEATELRGAVEGQAILLQTLTARIGELLERDRARDAAAAAAEQVPAAAPVAAPVSAYPGAAAATEPVPAPAPAPAAEAQPEHVVRLAEPVEALVPALGEADPEAGLDDLAMLRLRLIRAQGAGPAVAQPGVPTSATP